MPAKSSHQRSHNPVRSRKARPVPLKRIERESRGLSLFIAQITEFRLALALYNDPVKRDTVIRSLTKELAPQGIRVLLLDLSQPSEEQTLLSRVEVLVKSASPGERIAVMVINLESCIDYTPELSVPGSPGTGFVETANFHRDLFPNVCPGPLVIWMTELLERAFTRHAPDLWHWRSHIFDLRTRQASQHLVESRQNQALPSYDRRLHPTERLKRLEEELAAYRKVESRFDEMRVLNLMGVAHLDTGAVGLAVRDFETALHLARDIGSRSGEGSALGNLGIAYTLRGQAREAVGFQEKSLVILREIGDRRGESNALGNIGLAYGKMGDARKAMEFHEQALVIARELGDKSGEVTDLCNLGITYTELGDSHKAIEFYEQALAIARDLRDVRSEGILFGCLGIAYKNLGESGKAIAFYERQLVLARDTGDQIGEGVALWNYAIELRKLGDPAEAVVRGEAALALFEAAGSANALTVSNALKKWRQRERGTEAAKVVGEI